MNVETPPGASLPQLIVWTVVALGAINWALIGAMDTNLLGELLEPGMLRLAYILVGIAGVVDLIDLYTTESLLGGR